jgi:methyl-accepting chemotaxis protein
VQLVAALAAAACGAVAYGLRPTPVTVTTSDGARSLGREVLPVWRRHLAASRDEADRGVNELLTHFSSLSDGLDEAITATESGQALRITAGSGDELLERHPEALQLLAESAAALRRERQGMLAILRDIEAGQQAMVHVAGDIARLSRHANMLAMNAAIEANRAGQSHGGFGAVADEVRELSVVAHEAGERLMSVVSAATQRLVDLRRTSELADESDEAMEIETRQRARVVVDALVKEIGASMEQSRRLQDASRRLRDHLDGVFVSFQFQDRLNQMLGVLQDDMTRFEEWLAEVRASDPTEAARWLDRLESTYTMEEQRSFHHGTTEIRKAAGVEFF